MGNFDATSVEISSGLRAVLASFTSVGMSSVESVFPQDEQKRAPGGYSVPQQEQRAMRMIASKSNAQRQST